MCNISSVPYSTFDTVLFAVGWRRLGNIQCRFSAVRSRAATQTATPPLSDTVALHLFPVVIYRRLVRTSFNCVLFVVYIIQC